MRKIFVLLLGFLSFDIFSQVTLEKYQDSIIKKAMLEYYKLLEPKSGYIFPNVKAWYGEEMDLKDKVRKNQFSLFFPDSFLVKKKNGGEYFKLFLENNTKDTIYIDRQDATVGGLKDYFYLDENWVQVRSNGFSECGNSYFKSKLLPYKRAYLELESYTLIGGVEKVRYKVSLDIAGKTYFSNEIEVCLFEEQLKRLKELISEQNKLKDVRKN